MSLHRLSWFSSLCFVVMITSNAWSATLLHYNFNNGSGTTVTDLSGNGRHGTLVGFTDTSAGAGVFAQSEGWVAGGGLSTLDNGISSYVDTPLALNALGSGAFTLEYRASFTAPGASSQGGDANSFAPAIGGSHTFDNFVSLLLFGRRDNIGLEERLPGDAASSVGASGLQPWLSGTADDVHHIALTYTPSFPTGGNVRAYIDGVPANFPFPTNLPTTNFAAALGNFRILGSGHDPNLEWDGVIHAVAISNVALAPGSFVIPEPVSLSIICMGSLLLVLPRTHRQWN